MRARELIAALTVLAGVVGPAGAADRPLVVASVYPLYEFARAVAGDRAEVVALVPPGVEPHDWDPAPQDVVQVQKAKLFVYNGAGLEPWVAKLSRELAARGTVMVRATEKLALLGADPHVWLDPQRAQAQVESIRGGLSRVDPAGASAYAAQAQAYRARLATLDTAFSDGLRRCARRDVVTTHAAFAYLTQRYGLTQIPIQGLTPEAEPSPADLARLVKLAREKKVRYVFFETLVSPKLAETLAREVGAKTLVLNPIEGLTREEQAAGKSYLSLMEDNLRNLRVALDCS
jgi:zinc transport system substrate-binding protein